MLIFCPGKAIIGTGMLMASGYRGRKSAAPPQGLSYWGTLPSLITVKTGGGINARNVHTLTLETQSTI